MSESSYEEGLDYFRIEKKGLLLAYSRLAGIGPDMLERIGRNQSWIDAAVTELVADRFKLFIAGQMNCGKSTLANSLLFNRLVLPVYHSVMTSSITLIEHMSKHPGGVEGVQVQFYSDEEWRSVRQQFESDEQLRASFQIMMHLARERGAIASELIGSDPRVLVGFDELVNYIAPVQKRYQGCFTPFVKSVTLYANKDILRDLVVVDTPGTNDPNEQRAKLTENWIQQADAVVFVSYAGQALPSEDINFINRFMLHVPSSHRIIAVNKIDTVTDEAELDRYLRDLRSDSREAIRQVFSATTPTVCVCALGGLIADYEGALPSNMEGDRSRLFADGFLSPERHRMHQLRSVIEERLVKNKGENLLRAHREKVSSTYELAVNIILSDIAQIDSRMLERTRGIAAAKNKILKIQNENTRIKTVCERFNAEVELHRKRIFTVDAKQKIRNIVDGKHSEIRAKLALKTINAIKNDVDWVQREAIEEAAQNYGDYAEGIWVELERLINQKIEILRSDLSEMDFLTNKQVGLAIDKSFLLNLNNLTPEDLISPEIFGETIKNAQGSIYRFINNIFNTNLSLVDVVDNVASVVRSSIKDCLDGKHEEFKEEISKGISGFTSSVESEMRRLVEQLERELEEISNEGSDHEEIQASDKHHKCALEAELTRIRELQAIH